MENKREVVRQLHARGVQAVNLWEGLPLGVTPGDFPDTDELRRATLELPIHQDLNEAAIGRIATVVREVLAAQASSRAASAPTGATRPPGSGPASATRSRPTT